STVSFSTRGEYELVEGCASPSAQPSTSSYSPRVEYASVRLQDERVSGMRRRSSSLWYRVPGSRSCWPSSVARPQPRERSRFPSSPHHPHEVSSRRRFRAPSSSENARRLHVVPSLLDSRDED